jgi:hypothetical protein
MRVTRDVLVAAVIGLLGAFAMIFIFAVLIDVLAVLAGWLST